MGEDLPPVAARSRGAPQGVGFGDRTRLVNSTWGKATALDHPFVDLRRLHELRETIVPSRAQVFVHAPSERADAGVFDVTDEQGFVISFLPTVGSALDTFGGTGLTCDEVVAFERDAR